MCQLADIKGASGRQEFLGSFKRKVSATLQKCPTKARAKPKPKPCPKHLEVVVRKDIELVGHTEAIAKAICIIARQTSHHQHLAWMDLCECRELETKSKVKGQGAIGGREICKPENEDASCQGKLRKENDLAEADKKVVSHP